MAKSVTRSDAVVQRYELFVATAVVAAHASFGEQGFRQRDVKFLIELFSNWVEPSLQRFSVPVQNTQVQRYLNTLSGEGFARQVSKRSPPGYRLTRVGLLELLTRLVDTSRHAHEQHFFFLYYFIANYRPKIEQLITDEGKQFPVALRLEVDALMNLSSLLERQIEYVKREIKKVEERIHDARMTSQLTKKRLREGESLKGIVAEVERLYPYEFNSQKPLSGLIAEVPADMRAWELETGNMMRVAQIFEPSRAMLKSYLAELMKLQRAEK